MKVTVATVCFNACDMLAKTMASVAEQDYADMEYIVVDGGSSDGTRKLLEGWTGRLDKWVSEPDGGIYDAMNKAARMASGEWIIYMNAGDLFASSSVVSRAMAEASGDAAIVYGDVLKMRHGELQAVKAQPPRNPHRMFFCHQSCFTRTSILKAEPFDSALRYSADLDLVKRLYLRGEKMQQLDFPIAIFDTTGVSNSKRSAGLRENIAIVIRRDSLLGKAKLLPRLLVPYLSCKLRGK